MKILKLFIFLFIGGGLYCQVDRIEGVYAGENVYVQQYVDNVTDASFEFCLDSVTINDSITITSTKYAAFEIDLHTLRLGTKVNINFFGKDDCHVRILNRHALEFKPDFIEIKELDSKHVKFIVDLDIVDMVSLQFNQYQKWIKGNEWTIVDSVFAVHKDTILDFELKPEISSKKRLVAHLRGGGKNDYIVVPLDVNASDSSLESCVFKPKKPKTQIALEKEQSYVIYDAYGDIILQGKSNEIAVKSLVKGHYYIELEYCNDMMSFVKK